MTIREFAKSVNHEIIGKLTRRPEWEASKTERAYIDEGKNEYYIKEGNVVIVTADGGVI